MFIPRIGRIILRPNNKHLAIKNFHPWIPAVNMNFRVRILRKDAGHYLPAGKRRGKAKEFSNRWSDISQITSLRDFQPAGVSGLCPKTEHDGIRDTSRHAPEILHIHRHDDHDLM